MNLVRTLTLLATASFFTVPAYSQILTVGANCVAPDSKNKTLSASFDSASRRLMFFSDDLTTEYDQATLISDPITTPPQFEDKNNPLKIVSTSDQTISYVLLSTKNSISVSNSKGTLVYHCQAYFPGEIGMRY